MTHGWAGAYLGLIFQVYGLAFFVLGVAALLSMRRDRGTGLAAHLGWLAAFGMLHGLQEFIDGERLHNPAAWLVVLSTALMVVSFAALLESGRRLWKERPGGRRLTALPLYAAAGLGTVALMLAAPAATAGLELGARYLLGAPGAALAGIGLLGRAGATPRAADSVTLIRWLRIAALAMLAYAALTLFLSPGSGRLLAGWLPTTTDFLATTGLPVQLARALCAVLLAVGFVILNRHSGCLTDTTLRRVTDNLDGFVYRCHNDQNWTVTFMSEGGESLTGFPAADFLRGERHFADQIHPDDRQRVWDEVQAALAAQRDFRLQYRLIDRAGTLRWCYGEGRGVFDTQGELLYLEGLVRNDDERHQAEGARRRMQALVEASPQAVGWADPDGRMRYFNAALRTLLAVPEGVEVSGYRLRDFYDDAAFAVLESTVLPAALAHGAWIGEIELRNLDGHSIPTLHSVFVLRDEAGDLAAFGNVITDLSAVRRAERDLRIKETAIATSTSAIALAGLDGSLTYVNQAFVELWGLSGPEDAVGRSALAFWDEPDHAQAVVDALARTGRWQGELRTRRADGSLADVQLVWHAVRDAHGSPLCIMGSFLDVTARNDAQRALQRERDFAGGLLDTAPVIIVLLDGHGSVLRVNHFFEEVTGYRRDEVEGRNWFSTFVPDRERSRVRDVFRQATDGQRIRGNINAIVTRDGQEREVEWHAEPLHDADNEVAGVLSIGLDVTRRLHMERDLRRSESGLREAQRIARLGSWELDLQIGVLTWSEQIFRMFEIDPAHFAASYEGFLARVHPDDRDLVDRSYQDSVSAGGPYMIEHRLLMGDGRTKWVREQGETTYDEGGVPLLSRGTVQDITDEKTAALQIEKALREKDVLVGEIHHRVKNNLQVISSLLLLMGRRACDPQVQAALAEGHQRVVAMSMIHESLYQGDDVSKVECHTYLHRLVDLIGDAYAAEHRGIRLHVEVSPCFLSVDQATPVGMMVSELVSNALKHAFPGERTGRIRTSLTLDNADLVLRVQDDGIGLPEGFSPTEGSSLGWQIIPALVIQLGGTLDLGIGPGGGGFGVSVRMPRGEAEV